LTPFGEELEKASVNRGLIYRGEPSSHRIAAAVGVDHTVILGITKDGKRPTLLMISKIARAFPEKDKWEWSKLAGYDSIILEFYDRSAFGEDLLAELQRWYNITDEDMEIIRQVIEKKKAE